jgi:hypothetical protein
MSHKFLIPILTAAFLVAPAVLPRALVSVIAPSLSAPGVSGAAQAVTNLNSSRSNVYRTKKSRSPVTAPKAGGDADRMGGGGGARGGGALMGGGGGARMGGGGGANMGGGNVNRMGGGGGTGTK